MSKPELIFVAGPNAAGKSSFIRTRINELVGCEIIMTGVYKARTKEIFSRSTRNRRAPALGSRNIKLAAQKAALINWAA